jgi:hypothetical protein
MDLSHFRYKLLESNSDYKQSKIEKSGITAVFTLAEVEQHRDRLEQMRKELEAKATIERAKIKNIEDHHPFVKKLSEFELFTAHMYQTALNELKPAEEKLKEVLEAIDEYEQETSHIMETLGFQKAEDPITSPESSENHEQAN